MQHIKTILITGISLTLAITANLALGSVEVAARTPEQICKSRNFGAGFRNRYENSNPERIERLRRQIRVASRSRIYRSQVPLLRVKLEALEMAQRVLRYEVLPLIEENCENPESATTYNLPKKYFELLEI